MQKHMLLRNALYIYVYTYICMYVHIYMHICTHIYIICCWEGVCCRVVDLANPYPSWDQSKHGVSTARPLLLSHKSHLCGHLYRDCHQLFWFTHRRCSWKERMSVIAFSPIYTFWGSHKSTLVHIHPTHVPLVVPCEPHGSTTLPLVPCIYIQMHTYIHSCIYIQVY